MPVIMILVILKHASFFPILCSLLGKHDCWPQDSLSEQIQIVIAINRPDETVNTAIYNLSVYHIAMVTVNDTAMIL